MANRIQDQSNPSQTIPVLAFKIDRLLDNRAHLNRMKQNAQRLAKPLAAQRIVETIRDLETVQKRTSRAK